MGDNETAQVFYYFVESQRSPSRDPLMLWMSGGPGCSGLAGIFFESGMLLLLIFSFIFGIIGGIYIYIYMLLNWNIYFEY